jgi:hypothetical protein
MVSCNCNSWFEKIKEEQFKVKFKCPVHGRIELDSRIIRIQQNADTTFETLRYREEPRRRPSQPPRHRPLQAP